MVTKLSTPQDKIKLIIQVDELKETMKVGEAMKKLNEGGRDRYFEARRWLKENGYIDDQEQWTEKARGFIEILKPLIGTSRTSPAPAARPPGELHQVQPGAGQQPAARHPEQDIPRSAPEDVQEPHGDAGAKQAFRYKDRSGKARVFVTLSDEVFEWAMDRHERSGQPLTTIVNALVFKGYEAEMEKR